MQEPCRENSLREVLRLQKSKICNPSEAKKLSAQKKTASSYFIAYSYSFKRKLFITGTDEVYICFIE